MGRNKKYKIEDMHALALTRGGKFLSKEFNKLMEYYNWQCAKGHQWNASANVVKNNKTWCPYCSGSSWTISLNDLKLYAKKNDGLCLSSEYISNSTTYKWRCAKGHEWSAQWGYIKNGAWCRVCVRNDKSPESIYTIDTFNKIAEKHNGKVLSSDFINFKTKLKFECVKGHQWFADPRNIIYHNSWCPQCDKSHKLSLSQIKESAIKIGYICLSDEYKHSHCKLKWQCSKGHLWMARPQFGKEQTSCPVCARKVRADKHRIWHKNQKDKMP